jgi:8-oxo-dGTP pyrophosphatase MutT (NUDIX family)
MELIEQINTSLALHKRVELPAGPVPAAVLIPLFLKNGSCHILFTKRTENLQHHRGEVSFPGGVRHPDDTDILQTALRETSEEVGIAPEDVDILGALDDFLTIHNYLVTPYVGFVAAGHPLRINPAEVERIIEVPLSFLLTPSIFQLRDWTWQGRTLPLFCVDYEGDTIWGLTAAMLKQFIEIISAGVEKHIS